MFGLLIVLTSSVAIGVEPAGTTLISAIDLLQRQGLIIGGERICAARPLPLFYARRRYTPAWLDGDRLRPSALELIDTIQHAGDDGLRPTDYHLAAIGVLTREPASHGVDLDLLLTDAFLLFGSHLLSGRVDPRTIEPTWCLERRAYDLVAALETALETGEIRATLEQLAPAHSSYLRLRQELVRLRGIEARGGWSRVDSGRPLRKSDIGAGVEQLVRRLMSEGELRSGHAIVDDQVEAALQHFQRLHGLADDGVVGPRTLRELNVPVADRIRQVELNLERWRWLPSSLGDRYAIINIPEFRLRLIDGSRPILSMRIVVGKDYQRTPIFSSTITQVVFSPDWDIPESIAAKELWPKAARDRGFFAREHIEVLRNGRLRQTPGPWNSLGLLKFNLPNAYGVYLHDTPARELFDQSVRTFSHGCIRIEKPVDLATWLLRDDPAWTRQQIVTESQIGIERTVNVKNPLPVHVLYWTVFIGDDSEFHFAPDVYHRDPILDRAMGTRPPRF